MGKTESFAVQTSVGEAHVDLEQPTGAAVALLLIGHGAGGGVDAADILALRDVALQRGIAVGRVAQPYRVQGKKVPPAAPRLDAAWTEVAQAVRQRPRMGLPLLLAGRSSGARVACRTAGLLEAVAVVALAFPVHPPGKPEKSRLDELDSVKVPTLIVQGSSDAFGMPPAKGPKTQRRSLYVVAGADHSLRRATPEVQAAAGEFFDTVLAAQPS